ncbi:Cephalosporin-C deacetylase [Flaviramulus basaltis]|uniref:Cephalosporin-C deacetylase n=1 Tax=Flaviramulus basaltis TaxID=369401 RepID=A0A1K2IAN1_9FLAO|nr:Cephalosporin-C deacetylase [Flaviramulus basaltis]
MKLKLIRVSCIVALLLLKSISALYAQPAQSRVQVIVTPDHADWNYKLGEKANFDVKVLQDGQLVPNVKIHYSLGLEKMTSTKEDDIVSESGQAHIVGMKIDKPGFLECEVSVKVNNRTYKGRGRAAFEPHNILPAVTNPSDFDAFWSQAKAELAKVPIDPKLRLLPELCTSKINVYELNIGNIKNSRIYGVLSIPKAPGKYPAILRVPGAGVRSYGPDLRAEEGFITLKIGIHGIPVRMDDEVYNNLKNGALKAYWANKLDDLDNYYYKRVYLGCVRAVDYIFSMEEFDGENIAVNGASQGGGLSLVTAGLDPRIKYLAAFYPALCDLTGYLEERAGGWPHMFKNYNEAERPNWIKVAPYYDAVNFARRIKVPGWYSWGYNDPTCPPTSMFAAYNIIDAPKELNIFLETGHWTFPEQWEEADAWLYKNLKN